MIFTSCVNVYWQYASTPPLPVLLCCCSLQRGPASAAKLKERLLELGLDKDVVIMDGGFDKFGELYAADNAVVETGAVH